MNTIKIFFSLGIFSLLLLILSCNSKKDDNLDYLIEEGEEKLGGDLTVYRSDPNAFSVPNLNLSVREQLRFGVGNSFFNQNWVSAPASTKVRDGLGPFFNARACASCHFKDGRGRAPNTPGELSTGLLYQLSINGENEIGAPMPHPIYGGQLQDQAIQGITSKGTMKITYTEISGRYDDGETYSLRKPNYGIDNLGYGDIGNVYISPRVAPQIIGMGLLEAIPEDAILSNEDINDANGDGISGKANRVWNAKKEISVLGRFGWKANQPTIAQQIAGAFINDMGITNPIFSEHLPNPKEVDDSKIVDGGTPEINDANFNDIVFYTSVASVPARRNWRNKSILKGKQLFAELKCTKCHIPNFTTGTNDVKVLSNQKIKPYTDLLLHDMGIGLADDRSQFKALKTEWRTPPLWGIGLIQTVNKHTFYLHDGRARNLEEAILWHEGEAQASTQAFKKLSKENRTNLINFLNSL